MSQIIFALLPVCSGIFLRQEAPQFMPLPLPQQPPPVPMGQGFPAMPLPDASALLDDMLVAVQQQDKRKEVAQVMQFHGINSGSVNGVLQQLQYMASSDSNLNDRFRQFQTAWAEDARSLAPFQAIHQADQATRQAAATQALAFAERFTAAPAPQAPALQAPAPILLSISQETSAPQFAEGQFQEFQEPMQAPVSLASMDAISSMDSVGSMGSVEAMGTMEASGPASRTSTGVKDPFDAMMAVLAPPPPPPTTPQPPPFLPQFLGQLQNMVEESPEIPVLAPAPTRAPQSQRKHVAAEIQDVPAATQWEKAAEESRKKEALWAHNSR